MYIENVLLVTNVVLFRAELLLNQRKIKEEEEEEEEEEE